MAFLIDSNIRCDGGVELDIKLLSNDSGFGECEDNSKFGRCENGGRFDRYGNSGRFDRYKNGGRFISNK
ncbi:15784_t:CDS:2 [Funneliformis caledonium]|uniref:15784_t:CDS:1 n=1 Tax=Funneliformis caledonium TaxID=1117310 RepID=A0A9N9CC11_9GLOM|nr:15784_t:CDS:2 [Funneliformis caledonium]